MQASEWPRRNAVGWVMICAQLSAGAMYLSAMLVRIVHVLGSSAWPYGFLWRQPSGSQTLANAAFQLVRRLRMVRLSLC